MTFLAHHFTPHHLTSPALFAGWIPTSSEPVLEELGTHLAEKFKQSLAVMGVEGGRGVEAVVARRVDEETRRASGHVEGRALEDLSKKKSMFTGANDPIGGQMNEPTNG